MKKVKKNGRAKLRLDADVDANADATRYAAATDDVRSTNANEHARSGPKHDDVDVTARIAVRRHGYADANAAAWRSNRRLRLCS